jgi:hypothetical protein
VKGEIAQNLGPKPVAQSDIFELNHADLRIARPARIIMSPAGHIMCIFAARRVGLEAGPRYPQAGASSIRPTLIRPTIRWIDHPLDRPSLAGRAGTACRGVPAALLRA